MCPIRMATLTMVRATARRCQGSLAPGSIDVRPTRTRTSAANETSEYAIACPTWFKNGYATIKNADVTT